jgi:hypothetical protein
MAAADNPPVVVDDEASHYVWPKSRVSSEIRVEIAIKSGARRGQMVVKESW